MNLFALNGEALNGSPFAVTGAAAGASCGAQVDCAATRVVLARADLVGDAAAAANALRTAYVVADLTVSTSLVAAPTHTQAALAFASMGAVLVAAVLRGVGASAQISGGASFVPIPASTLGSANAQGAGALLADATKIQPGRADASTASSLAATALATRMVSAGMAGNGALRVEAQTNNQVDAFADLLGSSSWTVPDIGITWRLAVADSTGSAALAATATLAQPGAAQGSAMADLVAAPAVYAIPFVLPSAAGATLVADATRIVQPLADITGDASVWAPAAQWHISAADLSASAQLAPGATLIFPGSATPGGAAAFVANATAVRMPQAQLLGQSALVLQQPTQNQAAQATALATAGCTSDALASRMASASVLGAANMQPAALRTVYAAASLSSAAELLAAARAARMAGADMACAADMQPIALRVVLAAANASTFSAFTADSRTNIGAFDPPERTLRRPYINTAMRSPYIERTIRRQA